MNTYLPKDVVRYSLLPYLVPSAEEMKKKFRYVLSDLQYHYRVQQASRGLLLDSRLHKVHQLFPELFHPSRSDILKPSFIVQLSTHKFRFHSPHNVHQTFKETMHAQLELVFQCKIREGYQCKRYRHIPTRTYKEALRWLMTDEEEWDTREFAYQDLMEKGSTLNIAETFFEFEMQTRGEAETYGVELEEESDFPDREEDASDNDE